MTPAPARHLDPFDRSLAQFPFADLGAAMSRTVHCIKLGREAEGLASAPYPGPLGQRILEHVSKEAWQQWLAHQTMLINEHRLSPIKPDHRKLLEGEMEKFFFGEGSAPPAGYVPPEGR
jgi:Fe-S cluster biosynthesis and repair protein YggX